MRPCDQSRKNTVYCLEQGGSTNLKWINSQNNNQTKQYAFDNVYWETNTQDLIFQDIGQPIVYNALNGYNCSIFAYGQTGSGKSFTMFGHEENSDHEGLIPRVCKAILNVKLSAITFPNTQKIDVDNNNNNVDNHEFSSNVNTSTTSNNSDNFAIKVSYIEIYLERVKDLLSESTYDSKLKVRENPTTGTYVEGARLVELQTMEELQRLLLEGSRRRAVAITRMNENSSRSHAVFTIVISQTLSDMYQTVTKHSKIHLVDLAGSENNKMSGTNGMRQREASYINRSLLTLGRVILALTKIGKVQARSAREGATTPERQRPGVYEVEAQKPDYDTMSVCSSGTSGQDGFKDTDFIIDSDDEDTDLATNYDGDDVGVPPRREPSSPKRRDSTTGQSSNTIIVPYRDSVLTQLLRECIGGNSKTVLIATIRAEIEFCDDTLTTLRFAGMAKKVVNNAAVNQQTFTMSTIERLQRQVQLLESELASSTLAMKNSESTNQPSSYSSHDPDHDLDIADKIRDKQSEIEYLHATIRELTSQRDCARQVQQIQLEQIEEIRQKNSEREMKLLEDQRIKEEQIRFLMSIQNKTKQEKQEAKKERENHEGLSEAELRGREAFMCISMRKAQSEAAKLVEEVAQTPICGVIDSMANNVFKFYKGTGTPEK